MFIYVSHMTRYLSQWGRSHLTLVIWVELGRKNSASSLQSSFQASRKHNASCQGIDEVKRSNPDITSMNHNYQNSNICIKVQGVTLTCSQQTAFSQFDLRPTQQEGSHACLETQLAFLSKESHRPQNLLLPLYQNSIMSYYILNLFLIPTDMCCYHLSLRKPLFAVNENYQGKTKQQTMHRNIDHGESQPQDTTISQLWHLLLREHHENGRRII